MSFKRALVIALTSIAALPAAASAQSQIPPPEGDNYLGPVALSDFSNPGRFPSQEIGFIADTTAYTVQQDMYAPPGQGGPQEPTICGNAPYGNTVWSVFYSDRYGVMNVSAAGPFDSVIGVIPFRSPGDPVPNTAAGYCDDNIAGFQQDTSFLVSPKHWYAIQVGGTGNPQGGQVQVKFHLRPPPQVEGQAFLFWKTGPLRVSNMYAKNVPKGEKLTLTCTKGACRKKTITAKKPLVQRFGKKAVGSEQALRPLVQEAAKKVALLKNARVKKGVKIELRITQSGYIGKYYSWKVSSNSISSATSRCLNPGSSKPRKKCSG